MFSPTYRYLRYCVFLVILVTLSCGGPEQKKMKFYNKGKSLYEKGDYVKAQLEFKNALQIDPKFADAYYMLGMVALSRETCGVLTVVFSRPWG